MTENRSKTERDGLQDGSETYHGVWLGDSGTDKKIQA